MGREHYLIPDAPYADWPSYLAATGGALARARQTAPEALLATLAASGLRGRGGAGFATAVKWTSLANHPATTKYVVMNAAEGEPGTFKDRFLLRKNPYAALEGLLIGAHVIGARAAYIAAKASFTPELGRLRAAIAELEAAGLCEGLPIKLVEGPEEYLFGEEKALLNVIEGEGPLPRAPEYPPFEVGLFARPGAPNPCLVNNVETWARVSTIVAHGAASFRAIGSGDTTGPLIYTVSGDVAQPGVYELPAGLTLRKLFNEVAGGPLPGRTFKAALSGVSSGVIPADKFDTPADFGSLQLLGAGLGSAGFMVFDDSASMPRVTQALARFLYVESCYQCSSCKNGLRIASGAIDELFDPRKATPDDPERAVIAVQRAPQGNRCYLPVQGATLIPSLIKRYRAEFDDQVRAPRQPTRQFRVPKLTDYDEASHRFSIDLTQELKRPDWTYDEAPVGAAPEVIAAGSEAAARVAAQAAANAGKAKATIRMELRVPEELAAELRALAERTHTDLAKQMEQALREWVEKKRGS